MSRLMVSSWWTRDLALAWSICHFDLVTVRFMAVAEQETVPSGLTGLSKRLVEVRDATVTLCASLNAEDCNLQAIPETSPVKWHLAHTTWFFETFVLEPFAEDYASPDSRYRYLFNSYYNGVGHQFPRAQRSLLSRPTFAEVLDYRSAVDHALMKLIDRGLDEAGETEVASRITLGLHHEAQHQELLLTDLKYNFFQNPLYPAFQTRTLDSSSRTRDATPMTWSRMPGGHVEMGSSGQGFSFDNERPKGRALIEPFALADRLVTNAEFLEFVGSDGYRNPEFWIADGWSEVKESGSTHPLYWVEQEGQWSEFTLHGLVPLQPELPVSHVSWYEASAYAAWADKRLPTEIEWESVAVTQSVSGNFVESGQFHPAAAENPGRDLPAQLYGDCWEWTNSAYLPYSGFRATRDALGEYNGKFMSGQMVLRGGSCLSQGFHIRPSYRNFFYPRDRWQCAGIRLAGDL
jgi:ergothioneine biosynthesis protein EgtB